MPKTGHDIPQALAAQTLSAPYAAGNDAGAGLLAASFLTLAADPSLSSERIFTLGSGLSGVDGGAGLPYTLSVNQSFAFAWTGLQTWSQLAVFNAGARIAAGQALQFGTDVSLDRKGADILELGVGDNIESRTYTSGLAGWHLGADGSAEFENVRVRGELSASVFRISEITATAGTLGVFKSAATLYVDYTAPGSVGSSNTLTARNSLAGGSLLAAADRFRIKAWDGSAIRDLWFSVNSVGTNHGDNTDYNVKLESGTTGVTFAAGTALADYGPSGAGFITLSADGTIGSSANVSVADHAGSPWTTQTLRARLGNLNGSFGIATNLYGFGVGDFSGGNYLRYDPTNGFTLNAGGGVVFIDASGVNILIGTASTTQASLGFRSPLSPANDVGYLTAWEDTGSTTEQLELRSTGNGTNYHSSVSITSLAHSLKQAAVYINTVNNGTGDSFISLTTTAANFGYAWIGSNSDSGDSFSGLLVGTASASTTGTPNATLDVRGGISAGTGLAAGTGEILTSLQTTFTPAFRGSTIAGTFTYSAQLGYYIKIGGMVFFWGHLTLSAISVAPTGIMSIGGLPFAANGSPANLQGSVTFGMISNFKYTAAALALTGFIAGTAITLRESFTNAATVDVPAANFTNPGCNLIFSGFYRY